MTGDGSGDGIQRAEVRFFDDEDARRELALRMVKRHVAIGIGRPDYDADLEYLERALLAFADEWAAVGAGAEPARRVLPDVLRDLRLEGLDDDE